MLLAAFIIDDADPVAENEPYHGTMAMGDHKMPLVCTTHTKLSIRKHPEFNEAWLHERIADDPSILGLGDLRMLDHEKPLPGGGRLDLLLFDEDYNRRYEVEVMLGATDPSHIVRTIEYWDIERRRYPGYEHVAVLIAEEVTTGFLNVLSLVSGTILLIAIQLDAIEVKGQILLNFVQVLDQTELRIDDTEEEPGGDTTDRAWWEKKAGAGLMKLCDQVLELVNEFSRTPKELNYLRGYIGLKSSGVVRNFIYVSPKPTKKIVHISFVTENGSDWRDRFAQAGAVVGGKRKGRYRVSVDPQTFAKHKDLIRQAVEETVKEHGA
jgi:hypothetical protein